VEAGSTHLDIQLNSVQHSPEGDEGMAAPTYNFDQRSKRYVVRQRFGKLDKRVRIPADYFLAEGIDLDTKLTPRLKKRADELAKAWVDSNSGFVNRKKGRKLTLAECLEVYLDLNPNKVGESTLKSYRNKLAHVIKHLGTSFPEDITNAKVVEYRNKREKELIDGEVPSPRSVGVELTMLKAVIRWSSENDDVTGCSKMRFSKIPSNAAKPPRRQFLSPYELIKLADEVTDRPLNAHRYLKQLLILGVTTLLRESNLRYLCWKQLDLDAEIPTLTISRGEMKGAYRSSGDDHVIPLCKEAVMALESIPRVGVYVFLNPDTKAPYKVTGAMNRLSIYLTAHDLRRTGSSWLFACGVPDLTRKLLLGHSLKSLETRDVTVKYTNVAMEDKYSAVSLFDQILDIARSNGHIAGQEFRYPQWSNR